MREVPKEQLGTELRSFFQHVVSHDETGVRAAFCMVANKEDNGMHVCEFSAGDPKLLAQMLVSMIDSLHKTVPEFRGMWERALAVHSLQQFIVSAAKAAQEEKGMEKAKPEVDVLIEKLKNQQGPNHE